MPQTLTRFAAHPVLVEVVETRLVWVEAETAEQAEELAATYADAPGRTQFPLVDEATGTRAVTEELTYWLNAEPDEVERLDAYFAARASE
jgi:hypothetical protein